jgi:hypothetical protein
VQIFVISIYIKLKNRQNSFEALGNRIGDSYGEANTLKETRRGFWEAPGVGGDSPGCTFRIVLFCTCVTPQQNLH